MVIQEIDIYNIKLNGLNYKEKCNVKRLMILNSIKKHGQIYPIIVYKKSNDFVMVKGHTVLDCLLDLDFKKAFVLEIPYTNELESLSVNFMLNQSTRDVNILLLACLIEKLKGNETEEQLADIFGMKPQQVLVLKDLLKLEFVVNLQKDNSQVKMFEDETT